MNRPDMIVLVINFQETDKSKIQVSAKNFILGEPEKGERGELEQLIEEKLGSRTISCHKFSLIKYPVTIPGAGRAENRARGTVGLFRYIGSVDQVEKTLEEMKKVCAQAIGGSKFRNWEGVEIYTAERWSA